MYLYTRIGYTSGGTFSVASLPGHGDFTVNRRLTLWLAKNVTLASNISHVFQFQIVNPMVMLLLVFSYLYLSKCTHMCAYFIPMCIHVHLFYVHEFYT